MTGMDINAMESEHFPPPAPPAGAPPGGWSVYLIECRGGTLYAGIARDVDRRYRQHLAGKGARYTRMHPPLRLLAALALPSRSEAARAEWRLKRLDPAAKRRWALAVAAGSGQRPGEPPPG